MTEMRSITGAQPSIPPKPAPLSVTRRAVGVVALALVALTGCSGGDDVATLASGATTTPETTSVASVPTTSSPAAHTPVTTTAPSSSSPSDAEDAPAVRPPRPRPTAPVETPGGGNVGGGSDNEVAGAPLKMPALYINNGRALAAALPDLEGEFIELCGTPTLCVVLQIEERDLPNRTECVFDHLEPEVGALVPRGSTVTVVVGSAPARLGLPCSKDETDISVQPGQTGDSSEG